MHLFRFTKEADGTEVLIEAETREEAFAEFLEQQGWTVDEEDEAEGGWID